MYSRAAGGESGRMLLDDWLEITSVQRMQ